MLRSCNYFQMVLGKFLKKWKIVQLLILRFLISWSNEHWTTKFSKGSNYYSKCWVSILIAPMRISKKAPCKLDSGLKSLGNSNYCIIFGGNKGLLTAPPPVPKARTKKRSSAGRKALANPRFFSKQTVSSDPAIV